MREIPAILVKSSYVLNTVTCGPSGYSLCARAYRNRLEIGGIWHAVVRVIDAVFWFDPQHCRKAFLYRETNNVSKR